MNIFVLDYNPVVAAQAQCDKHIVKMCLETAQMLCTALHHHGVETEYKPTHVNHPCNVWVRENKANFLWLCEHGVELCREYTSRYKKIHKCESVIWSAQWKSESLPEGCLTPFAQAMPDQYKNACAVEAYRNYYTNEKLRFATWRKNKPDWVGGADEMAWL